MNKHSPNQIMKIVSDKLDSYKQDKNAVTYWIRDFSIADNDNPFQYENLNFEQLTEVVQQLDSMFIRIGFDADIMYDYYDQMDKTCNGHLIESEVKQ